VDDADEEADVAALGARGVDVGTFRRRTPSGFGIGEDVGDDAGDEFADSVDDEQTRCTVWTFWSLLKL